MGLNLSALASLTKKVEETQSGNSTVQSAKELHNAPSQQTEKPSATSILASLANPSAKESNKATTTIQPVDQSNRLSAGDPRTIKYQEISDKIVELRDAIHGAHPRMPGLLQEIWSTVIKYPEQVTLLEEDQMEVIIAGLEKQVDTDLAQITLKSATSGKGKKTPVTASSLGF